jgi:uncharacterized membrane protein (UPF0182 family)
MSLFGGTVDETSVGSINDNEKGGQSGGGASGSVRSLIMKAQNAYDKAIECQKNGDWERYGKYIGMLEQYLTKLDSASNTVQSADNAAADADAAAAETAEAAE